MTNEERQNYRIRTECAIEILKTVHSNLCNDPDITRDNPLPEDYGYVITDLIKLSAKLKDTNSSTNNVVPNV